MGLYGYHLPDMFEIAKISHEYYNNDLRGGEGHMEVGKLIMNVVHSKAHMTLSVKPFGCMPSAGVSDGVQSAITEKFPGTIFCPVETSGDGRVNFYSRVQMYLFKAKQAAIAELERALRGERRHARAGARVPRREPALRPRRSTRRRTRTPAPRPISSPQVAPYITKSRARALARAHRRRSRRASGEAARKSPHMVVAIVKSAVDAAPEVAARLKEDVALLREARRAKKSAPQPAMDAAAE